MLAALLAGLALIPAAPSCQNLVASPTLRSQLASVHARPKEGKIEPGSLYYGGCGTTRYAIGTFSGALADQPEKFRKLSGHPWHDMGDGFEDGCSRGARYPIPYALVRLWGFCG